MYGESSNPLAIKRRGYMGPSGFFVCAGVERWTVETRHLRDRHARISLADPRS